MAESESDSMSPPPSPASDAAGEDATESEEIPGPMSLDKVVGYKIFNPFKLSEVQYWPHDVEPLRAPLSLKGWLHQLLG